MGGSSFSAVISVSPEVHKMLQKKFILNKSTVKPSIDTSQAVTGAVNENVSVSKHITHASDAKESSVQATGDTSACVPSN